MMRAIAADIPLCMEGIASEWCVLVGTRAREVIGTYDYGWTPLAPSTIAHKAMGDTPLLETGEMRDSIEAVVIKGINSVRGIVGSNSDIAVYQELGTSRIPPRSFLQASAMRSEKDIERIAKKYLRATFNGRGAHGSELREILHLIRIALEVLHAVIRTLSK